MPEYFSPDPLMKVIDVHWSGAIEISPLAQAEARIGPFLTDAISFSCWFNFEPVVHQAFGGQFAIYWRDHSALLWASNLAFSGTPRQTSSVDSHGPDAEEGFHDILHLCNSMPGLATNQWHHLAYSFHIGGLISFVLDGNAVPGARWQENDLLPHNIYAERLLISAPYQPFVPDNLSQFSLRQKLRVFDLRVWLGYIDFLSNIHLFYRADGRDDGARVGANVAHDVFGKPNWRFNGGAEAFKTSKGLDENATMFYSGGPVTTFKPKETSAVPTEPSIPKSWKPQG